MCDPERLLASKNSGANIHFQITYAPLEIRPSPVQPVSEINLFYFWPFLYLYHIFCCLKFLSLQLHHLSVSIKNILGVFRRHNTSTAVDFGTTTSWLKCTLSQVMMAKVGHNGWTRNKSSSLQGLFRGLVHWLFRHFKNKRAESFVLWVQRDSWIGGAKQRGALGTKVSEPRSDLPYFSFFLGGPIGGICWEARALNASAMRCGWVATICFHPAVSTTSVTCRLLMNSIACKRAKMKNSTI